MNLTKFGSGAHTFQSTKFSKEIMFDNKYSSMQWINLIRLLKK